MGANPHANGGAARSDLALPDFRDYAVDVPTPGDDDARGDARAGRLPARRDARTTRSTFRLLGPDETASNRLDAVFEVTDRAWTAEIAARPTTTWHRTAASWRS